MIYRPEQDPMVLVRPVKSVVFGSILRVADASNRYDSPKKTEGAFVLVVVLTSLIRDVFCLLLANRSAFFTTYGKKNV